MVSLGRHGRALGPPAPGPGADSDPAPTHAALSPAGVVEKQKGDRVADLCLSLPKSSLIFPGKVDNTVTSPYAMGKGRANGAG